METVSGVQLVLRQTCGRQVRWNVKCFFFSRVQICKQLLLEFNLRRRLFYKYKHSGRLTYFGQNSLEFVNGNRDSNSKQTKLLSQNATSSFFFDPEKIHFWKECLAIMVSDRYHQKMFRNNESFVFLAVIGFVTLGSKVTFSGRSAAFSSLSQRSRF